MGNIYYRGTQTSYYSSIPDKRVETRNDQYLDYVDNDLVFKTDDNVAVTNEEGIFTGEEISEKGITNAIGSRYLTYTASEISKKGLMKGVDIATTFITDGLQKYYSNEDNTKNNLAFNIESVMNDTFYKYLNANSRNGLNGNYTATVDNMYSNELKNSLYFIDLQASRTLTSEADAEGMAIDNIAEIIKVTNIVGRKVYVESSLSNAGYIGNSKIEVEKVHNPTNNVSVVTVVGAEIDTDFTEYVTFSPPTGLTNKEIKAEKTVDTIMIIVAVLIVIAGSTYIGIKVVTRKKFYK